MSIYLRTNYLLCVYEPDDVRGYVAVPLSGHFGNAAEPAAVTCELEITRQRLLTANQEFLERLTYDGFDEVTIKRITPRRKRAFIEDYACDINYFDAKPNDIIWNNGFYTYNIVPSNIGKIAIPGDFQRLSNAFMHAISYGAGYVDITVNKDDMSAEISFKAPLHTVQKPQKTSNRNIK